MSESNLRYKKIKYLSGYYWTLENLKLIQEKIDRKNDRLYGVRSPIVTDMPRGGKGKDTVDIIGEKQELESTLQKRLHRAKGRKVEIEDAIYKIRDERAVMLLELHYIDNLSLYEVADTMHVSYSRIKVLHSDALNLFIIPESPKRASDIRDKSKSTINETP